MTDRGYRWIYELKKETGEKRIPDLLALSANRDPFFYGSPNDVKRAEWFAAMWKQKYDGQTGIHIRRVHYHLDASSFPKLDSMPYHNTKTDWEYLQECSRAARILGLVPADAFDDHRNADPYPLHWRTAVNSEPIITSYEPDWSLPQLWVDLSRRDWTIDEPGVEGYDPNDYIDRAYYLEVWIEKSTMDDILVPLSQELGFRPVPSSGYQSISNAVKLLQRVRRIGKPARAFYISDYDRAGKHMPVAVARQIEYWWEQYAPGADIKLRPLVLTAEQIAKYKLPSSEEGNKTELDALEAIVPGELERIVREAVAPYLDDSIDAQLAEARREARQIVRAEWSALIQSHERRLRSLQKRIRLVTGKYGKQAARLNARLAKDLKRFKKPLAKLQAEVSELQDQFSPDLPARPVQDLVEEDADEWLFDSSRSYLDQLASYKARRGNE